MKLKTLVQKNRADIAFVVGNGINRHKSTTTGNSWEELLLHLWNKYFSKPQSKIPSGISLTEYYDVLDIIRVSKKVSLQSEFCDLMRSWSPAAHHIAFVQWAKKFNSPILTTNFESTLSDAANCEMFRSRDTGFTDFYPWESYYASIKISDPLNEFGIWHVNGMQKYHRSIRLGLSHYMGSVDRARGWLHSRKTDCLFNSRSANTWKGMYSWLHIIFNKPLIFFGLGLGQDEVFLRWLLIERAKYYRKYPARKKSAWFVHNGNSLSGGSELFLENLNVVPIKANSYDEIYEEPW